ncbi:MAG: hypothetical protein F9K29_16115 [Hyphomicrobiaceae bacterium]|nr:MAG: hypothetical protein F9K29_16115 [Hyphomicrobiaceae bacterium]
MSTINFHVIFVVLVLGWTTATLQRAGAEQSIIGDWTALRLHMPDLVAWYRLRAASLPLPWRSS